MRNAIILGAGLLLTLGVGATRADEPVADPAATAHAERLAIGTCGTCHGVRGVSQQPKYPRLAGQNPSYLAAQLRAFRGQQRGDPDAIGYMWGMSASLEDSTIDALAAYYAAQPAPPALSVRKVYKAQPVSLAQPGRRAQQALLAPLARPAPPDITERQEQREQPARRVQLARPDRPGRSSGRP